MPTRVLIVDDEPGILSSLAAVLTDEGCETATTNSGEEALDLYRAARPDVVFLDIWMPDRDGLETLQALLDLDPSAAVVMMSGHGTATTAVKAIKMGACDYVEKPLSYNSAVEALKTALEYGASVARRPDRMLVRESGKERLPKATELRPPPRLGLVRPSDTPQRTIRESTVIYGLGLHSGSRTGMVLQPLPPNTGVHFQTLPTGTRIPAHVDAVADTDHATTLAREGHEIRTVEHLLSALHAYGITNLFVKVHGEIPVLDGSALEFCRTLEDAGIEDQPEPRLELVIDRPYEIRADGEQLLRIEPFEGFSVAYDLKYPPPVGEQSFRFTLTGRGTYKRQVAPARTFGFMRDLTMMAELGLGSGGRLDNCILIGEGNVINTDLRFRDELVRHKVLDIIGDLYLLGFPVRGKVTARYTGHRDNIELLRAIQRAQQAS